MTCWICGKEADSKEHIIKKSDITRAYGNGPYKGENALAHIKNGKQQSIQGPNSKKLKYQCSLCHDCNTTTTQPFDFAYDGFVNYLLDNKDIILKRRFVNFADVYGPSFENAQRDLYKYFVKSFGCRLHSANISIPPDLISLFQKESFRTGLRINFSVHEDVLILPKKVRDGFIGKGDLLIWTDENDQTIVNGYTWDENVSWLFVSYWYLRVPDGRLGSPWVADSQFVYLGSRQSFDKKQREELMQKTQSNA